MAPTIQKEIDTGRIDAARMEATVPTRIASRQLSAATLRRDGAGRAVRAAEMVGVIDMVRGTLLWQFGQVNCSTAWCLSLGIRPGDPIARGRVRNRGTLPRYTPRAIAAPGMGTAQAFVTSLDQPRFLEQILLELGDIVQGHLCVLLAGDREVELVLLLGQEVE